uniref:Uncharacterized protein n=1 Tax=Gossypium raimondii TaxID=29730 RepID=A0A0D2V746_GOSRA|nr:hypothetical protein B456_010G075900 [Gossypium raimondii]
MLGIPLMKDQPLGRLSLWVILKLPLIRGEIERRHQLCRRNWSLLNLLMGLKKCSVITIRLNLSRTRMVQLHNIKCI